MGLRHGRGLLLGSKVTGLPAFPDPCGAAARRKPDYPGGLQKQSGLTETCSPELRTFLRQMAGIKPDARTWLTEMSVRIVGQLEREAFVIREEALLWRERYRVLFGENVAGTILTTPEGHIVDCNEA